MLITEFDHLFRTWVRRGCATIESGHLVHASSPMECLALVQDFLDT